MKDYNKIFEDKDTFKQPVKTVIENTTRRGKKSVEPKSDNQDRFDINGRRPFRS